MEYIQELLERKKKEYEGLSKGIRLVECDNLLIGAACGAELDDLEPIGKDIYYPYAMLIYVESGFLDISFEGRKITLGEGEFYIVKKFTDAYIQNRKSLSDKHTISYAFALYNHFLEKVIGQVEVPDSSEPISDRILKIDGNRHLHKVINTVRYAIDAKLALETKKVEALVLDTLVGIVSSNPKYLAVFKDYSRFQRGDLELFMNRNFAFKYTLEQFASMSGRSLSTFHREFRAIFNTTPHKWLLRKRLHWADTLLRTTTRTVSEVAYEVNFEDIAHFSKAYKNEFGISPSTVQKADTRKAEYSFVSPENR